MGADLLMYYLFIRSDADKAKFMREFERVKANKDAGKTPVFSEIRSAKTNLIETVPYNILNGAFLILSTLLIQLFGFSELLNIALVVIMNNLFGCISNFLFVVVKHYMRIRLCNRLGIEPSEDNIAVFESLEYQSV